MSYSLVLSLLLSLPIHPKHDFHTSITEINYNTQSKSFEVSLKVFYDDFEDALNQANMTDTYLENTMSIFSDNTDEKSNTRVELDNQGTHDEIIETYLKEKFSLKTKDKSLEMSFVGTELDVFNNVFWIFFEFPHKGNVKEMTISNSVLLEVFDDQKNIINLNYKTTKKTFLSQAGIVTHSLGLE